MADLARGRQIFLERVEYPLPAKAGIKDYVVYFVDDEGYGAGAREFLGRFYKNHVPIQAKSLEEMFAKLQAEIESATLTQIRELVIVAHGNAVQLFLPVVNSAPGVDPVYRCVTEYSLAELQDDMKAGDFASMSQARKVVSAHMLEDSWVTIRACNIGQSSKVLYGLYALFGGRANVYAPTLYMFFGDCFVGPTERVTTKFGVYEYLVKQHFLPTSEHTLDRQAAIISDLLDPESYSMPFELASVHPVGGHPDQLTAYGKLVDELNAFRLSATLRGIFQAKGFPLSAGASVVRSTRFTNVKASVRSVWFILDRTVQSDGASFDLVYEIHDQTSGQGDHIDTLEAKARIASLVSSGASFPFQLFFDQDVDDQFKGIVARLAGYADGGLSADVQQKTEFASTEALLNAGQWVDGTIDLAEPINSRLLEAGLEALADPPPPIQQPTAGSRGVWTVGGAQPLAIRREASKTTDGFAAFSITVYRVLTSAQRVKAEHEVYSKKGRVSDTPGTELTAYLDRFTIDELDGLLAFLRATYRPAFAYYVRNTQQAMTRKRDFEVWHASHLGNAVLDDYSVPRPGELSDMNAVAFPFEFNQNWREVKASSRYVTPVQNDLWEEEPLLRTKLKVEGTWICDSSVPNSPSSSRADAREAQVPGNERHFAHTPDKSLWESPPQRRDGGCGDFRMAIEKWKELRVADTTPEVLKGTLEEIEDSEGESYYKKIKETLEPLHLSLELTDLLFDTKVEPYVLLTEHLADYLAEHGFTAAGEAFELGAFFGWLAPVFTVPFEMWVHAIEPEVEAVEEADFRGQLLALRLWVYKLDDLTVTQVPFPGSVSIDLPETFEQAWDKVYARDYPYFGDTVGGFRPFRENSEEGFAFAVPKVSEIGLRIVEEADKALSERIAGLGLPPCHLKALTDIGLLDFDKLRRQQIHRYAIAYLDSWRKI